MKKLEQRVPNLRFKGFTDDWEQRKLGEISERILRKNSDLQSLLPLTISAQDGLVDQTIYFNKQVASKQLKNYLLLYNGDFAYNKSYSVGYPYGAIKRLDKYKQGVLSTLYIAFKPTNINSDFLQHYYDTDKWYREIYRNAAEGARNHGLLNISANDFFNSKLITPSDNDEQLKIAKIINVFNRLITLQQRKLDLLKQLKKGFLQKMFAEKNSKQPVLRFKGFHDGWEQWKLSKVKDVRDGTHDSPKYHEKGFPLITSKNLTPSGVDFSDASLIDEHDYQEINKRSLVEIHDILFGMIGTIGNPVIVKKSGFAIKNVALIKHGGNLSNYFLLNLLNSPIFAKYINKENAGGTQKFLSLSIIRNFRFLAPGSDEQNKIGNMFEQVDTFITLQQQKLAKYQSIKKSLLQQMFI